MYHSKLILSFFIVLFLIANSVSAQPGSLDNTFNSTGIVLTQNSIQPTAMTLQSDGKIIIAGSAYEDIEMIRYNPDGSIDQTFGNQGLVKTNTVISYASISSVVMQGTNILVGGNGGYPQNKLFVARFDGNGSIDSSFGVNGLTVCDTSHFNGPCTNTLGNPAQQYYGGIISLQSDGKIIQGGTQQDNCPGTFGTRYRFFASRYNGDGSLDTSFHWAGAVALKSQLFSSSIISISDSELIVSGYGYGAGPDSLTLVPMFQKFNSNLGFNTYFILLQNSFKVENFYNYWMLPSFEGGYYIGGYVGNGNLDSPAVMKILPPYSNNIVGYITPDSSFGIKGVTVINPGAGGGSANAGIVQPDGKLLVAANFNSNGFNLNDFAVIRLDSNGNLDNTFGTGGVVENDLNHQSDDIPSAIVLQPDGKILVCGESDLSSSVTYSAVVRYNNDQSLGFPTLKAETNLHVYPNPVHESLYVTSATQESGIIAIMDITGRVVQSLQMESNPQVVDMSRLSAGVYVFTLKNGGITTKERIIKQ